VPTAAEIQEIKRRVSDQLLQIPGVTGLGIPAGRLTVYLERDTRVARERAMALLNAEAPGTPVDFIVTGVIRSS
jgi:hypothetical protein